MLAVVLAAGRGTRLRPLTNDCSKAMMPIAGEPMIERVMEMLAQGGAARFIVVAHPDDQDLIEHLHRPPWNARAQIAYQEQRLGMAHAVQQAAPLVRKEDVPAFLLASCDNLYPQGHASALIERRREKDLDAALTLTWVPREKASATAVVVLKDEQVARIVEKPRPEQIPDYSEHSEALVAPSLYALSPRVLNYLPQVPVSARGEREFPDALRLLIEDNGAVGGRLVADRMTLTRPRDLLTINRHFLHREPSCATVEANVPRDTTITPPVRIEQGVKIETQCQIGPGVYLEGGCSIGAGATLRRAVVLKDASVETNTLVKDEVIV